MTAPRTLFAAALTAGALALATAPASAKTDKETPGSPCTPGGGKGTGNPCKGNNGNPSPQGNVGKENVDYDYHPAPFKIERPNNSRGAFIDQVGDANTATITQTTSDQYARIGQSGGANTATIAQGGTGAHYATADQIGDGNALSLSQSGVGVQVAILKQDGSGNAMMLGQNGGALSSGLFAAQTGDYNRMTLTQSGDSNQAALIQNGDGNAMTVDQEGANNQLAWTQNGDNLSDLQITQSGNTAMQVTQSR
jgi:hypothetical protein